MSETDSKNTSEATSEKKYLIGEVSKITGISKDTLRFYDKIHLVKPKYVDPENNYRYYTYDQFWTLDIITCCRSLNIPIEQIRSILNSNSNDMVLSLLQEQYREARRLSRYYQKIARDIEWYTKQNQQLQTIQYPSAVTVRHFPKRAVLYGRNPEDTHAYHLKLQEICQKALKHNYSIRRNYGFILDETRLHDNLFIKKGEYLQFDEKDFKNASDEYLTYLPEGDYACCIVDIKNDTADFSPLLDWLQEHHVTPEYVIADELGLQLFEYLDHGYLCEVKILLN